MKRVLLLVLLIGLFAGCTGGEKKSYASTPEGEIQNPPAPPTMKIGEILVNAKNLDNQFVNTEGEVKEVVHTQSYTYALVGDDSGEVWVAGPRTDLKKGQQVKLEGALVLLNFKSPALNKTLDVLLMTQSFSGGEPYSFHGMPSKKAEAVNVSVEKLPDGYTIAEILKNAKNLTDKKVKFRAVVTKVLPDIMGKTWIHLQDGTQAEEGNEIIVTYSGDESVQVGDVVVVEGVVHTDVDLGSGYFFNVLVEDASIKRE